MFSPADNPFAELSAELWPSPREHTLAWLVHSPGIRSPWDLLPSSLLPPPVAPPTSRFRIALRRLGVLWPFGRQRPPQQPQVGPGRLKDLLSECHRRMAFENQRYVMQWTPRGASVPPSLLETSGLAITWSLIAEAALRQGPTAITAFSSHFGRLHLDPNAPAGDLLVLHRCVEVLATAWVPPPATGAGADPKDDRGGGLRSRRLRSAFERPLSARHEALLTFASCSPLTCFAYMDVLPQPASSAPKAPPISRLLPPLSGATGLWRQLLANTLYAALLGPVAGWQVWREKEDTVPLGKIKRRTREVERGHRELQALRKAALLAFLSRLQAWSSLVTRPDQKDSLGDDALLDLHLLVLDRMVRYGIVRWIAMDKRFARSVSAHATPIDIHTYQLCVDALWSIVLGVPIHELTKLLPLVPLQQLREQLALNLRVLLALPDLEMSVVPRGPFVHPAFLRRSLYLPSPFESAYATVISLLNHLRADLETRFSPPPPANQQATVELEDAYV